MPTKQNHIINLILSWSTNSRGKGCTGSGALDQRVSPNVRDGALGGGGSRLYLWPVIIHDRLLHDVSGQCLGAHFPHTKCTKMHDFDHTLSAEPWLPQSEVYPLPPPAPFTHFGPCFLNLDIFNTLPPLKGCQLFYNNNNLIPQPLLKYVILHKYK